MAFKGNFSVLGIHGERVRTVEGNVARVRFFIDGHDPVDEDVALPTLPRFVTPTDEVYEEFLRPTLERRYAEIVTALT